MKHHGTRRDRLWSMTNLIYEMNEMLARHVRDVDVQSWIADQGPVEIGRPRSRSQQERPPDFALRLKTLRQRAECQPILDELQLLIDCRIEHAHQIPISVNKLNQAFDAAQTCCSFLNEPEAVLRIAELREQRSLSQTAERLQKTERALGFVLSTLDEREQRMWSLRYLLKTTFKLSFVKSALWTQNTVRAWNSTREHPAGPVSGDRRDEVLQLPQVAGASPIWRRRSAPAGRSA